ncbi:PAS domain S-box protein [Glycocaulis sp.]|uniref:PAS domain S-box protein n=1 Tax=Glycocaulis sp. TaxID=1969725 RepID=UPI003D20E643
MSGDITRDIFFQNHPDPMLIYELATRRILVVNQTFQIRYGYTDEDLTTLRLDDLHPEDELDRLESNVAAVTAGLDRAGIWQHRLKSGEFIHVEITSHTMEYEGKACELVVARDMTELVRFEKERDQALKREETLRSRAEAAAYHFQSLFEAAPGMLLVLEPEGYTIVAISDAYLEATMRRRADIMGKPLFDVFPDDPDDPDANGVSAVTAVLERVKESGLSEALPLVRFPVERPEEEGGGFEERWWLSVFSAVKGPDGRTQYVICRSEDVTGLIASQGRDTAELAAELAERPLELDLMVHSRELREATLRLNEREASIRTVERLLALGQWRFDLQTQKLEWSDSTFRMYGLDPETCEPDYDLYVSLVHPDDRTRMESWFADFIESGERSGEFWHRIVRPDGRVITVRGVAERAITPEGEATTGFVQDITGQLETDARLSEADHLLRLAGKSARFGAWRVDLGRGVAEWSEEVADIHDMPGTRELPVEDAIGFYAPESVDRLREVYEHCINTGQAFDEMLVIISAKGRRVWCRSIGEAERNAAGEVIAVRGAFQDISELVSARLESAELAERLQNTLNTMSDAFYLLDEGMCFSFVNKEAERALRTPRQDLLGKHVWDVFPGAREALEPYYQQAMDTGESANLSFWYDELGVWFRVRVHPGPDGLAVYFQDITEEREAQEQLYLLEKAVARANDVVIIADSKVTDEGPRIVYVNDAFERVFGYTRDEVVGQSTSILRGPLTDRETLEEIFSAFRAMVPVRTEIVHYTRSGDGRWMDVAAVPITDTEGRHTHWLGVQRDITERKRDEEALRIARDEAEEANRLKSEFLANMSHEIRTPLNGVLGMSQLLARTDLDARQTRMIETVQTSGKALLSIINDILDLSKIEAGLMTIEPEAVEVDALCEQALSSVRGTAQNKALALDLAIDEAVPGHITADRRRLAQVLINLLGNAVKFTEAGSVWLNVDCPDAQTIRFEVTDTGPGISPQQAEHIFDRFRQVDASYARRHEGTGLGLALSKEFASLMGGHITLHSRPGEGSRFAVHLPLVTTRAGVAGGEEATNVVSLPKDMDRILVAEDNATNRETLEMFLDELGLARPVCVTNGREAVERALAEDFSLIIMDVSMPVMSGLDAIRAIRASTSRRRHVPILALTAHAAPQDREECLQAGANDYLAKPVDLAALASALSKLVGKRIAG